MLLFLGKDFKSAYRKPASGKKPLQALSLIGMELNKRTCERVRPKTTD